MFFDRYLIETSVDTLPIIKTNHSYMIKDNNGAIISKLNYHEFNIKNFDWVLISDLETKPKYRGKGLATKLINSLYNDVTKSTNKGIYLAVSPTNNNAISLYTKLNFKIIKEFISKDGERYIIMAKGNADASQFDTMNFS